MQAVVACCSNSTVTDQQSLTRQVLNGKESNVHLEYNYWPEILKLSVDVMENMGQ